MMTRPHRDAAAPRLPAALALGLALALAWISPSLAWACSPNWDYLAKQRAEALEKPVIFFGELVRIDTAGGEVAEVGGRMRQHKDVRLTFEVLKPFRGVDAGQTVVLPDRPRSCATGGVDRGGRFVVSADRQGDSLTLFYEAWSREAPFAPGAPAVAFDTFSFDDNRDKGPASAERASVQAELEAVATARTAVALKKCVGNTEYGQVVDAAIRFELQGDGEFDTRATRAGFRQRPQERYHMGDCVAQEAAKLASFPAFAGGPVDVSVSFEADGTVTKSELKAVRHPPTPGTLSDLRSSIRVRAAGVELSERQKAALAEYDSKNSIEWDYRDVSDAMRVAKRFKEARALVQKNASYPERDLSLITLDERGLAAKGLSLGEDGDHAVEWARKWPASGLPPSFAAYLAAERPRGVLTEREAARRFEDLAWYFERTYHPSPHLCVALADLLARRDGDPSGLEILTASMLYSLAAQKTKDPTRALALKKLASSIGGLRYPPARLEELVATELREK